MGTKDRRTRVLKAIVRDYVSAREPVGCALASSL